MRRADERAGEDRLPPGLLQRRPAALGHTASFNNLYSSIPFTFSITNGKAHGLFFDNTHRVEFDLALEDENRAYYGRGWGHRVLRLLWADPKGGRRPLHRAHGPHPDAAAVVFGEPAVPLLLHERGRGARGREGFRERDIPCDVIYLDIHYMDGYRVFTWNEDRFPDPRRLISDLREQGFRVVTIVDPGVKVDENYSVYTEGRRGIFTARRARARSTTTPSGPVCAFPDFTNPETRGGGARTRGLTDAGVAGIWCDMNEPALFIPDGATMPDDVVHPGGRAGEARWHAQIHNTYGSLMARAAREGLLALRPEERPFVITAPGTPACSATPCTGPGQLQLVGAPVDEHATTPEPRPLRRRLGRCRRGRIRRRHERRAPGPLDGVRGLPTLLPQPHHDRNPPPGAVGLRSPTSRCAGDDQTSPAPPPLPLLALRRVPQDGRADPAPPPVRVPRGRDDLHGRRRVPARRRPPRCPITRPGIEHRHVYLPEGTWFHYYSGERFEGPVHILAHAPWASPPST